MMASLHKARAILALLVFSLGFLYMTAAPAAAVSLTPSLTTMGAANVATVCKSGQFFGLVPWYHYLTLTTHEKVPGNDASAVCDVCFNVAGDSKNFDPNCSKDDGKSDIPLIGLAIVDDLLRIAGLVAVGYVIYGGIRYITSQGAPDETAKAQGTIVNALIGLAVALVAVAFVSFIGHALGG